MAGGEGTRLRPLTTSLPKPLLPVGERPIMEHVLRLLRRHGIRETVVTVQFLAHLIQERFGDGSGLGMSLTYAHEETPLGTAGSVKNAERELAGAPFLVISGDALTDIDLSALIRHHRERGALVTVCLTRVPDPLEFGVTVLGADGRIERFLEKPTWGEVFSDTVNTGIYVMEPEVLARVPAGEPVDWSGDVFPRLIAEGAAVHGYVADGYWQDVGTLDSYRQAQTDLLDGRVDGELPGTEVLPGVWVADSASVDPEADVRGPVVIGEHARVAAGARVHEHSVIGAHGVVEPGAHLHRAVLHPYAYAGPHTSLRGCVVGRNATTGRSARLEEGVIVGEDSRVGQDAVVSAGVVVNPARTIGPGAVIGTDLIWDGRGSRSLFGPRGVSGVVNVDLTAELVVRLAGAYATTVPHDATVTVARDHAQGSRVLAAAVVSALQSSGVHVRDLGHVPVPVARREAALTDGGVLLTATPGAADSVSLTFLDEHGVDLGTAAQRKLERLLHQARFRRAPAGEFGGLLSGEESARTAITAYTERLLRLTGTAAIRERAPKVVVDAAFGSGALVLPGLLDGLGVRAVTLNTGLDDERATETDIERRAALRYLGDVVAANDADFGVRVDPTGQRIAVVDERGGIVPDETLLLLLAGLVTAERPGGTVVLPPTVSRAAESVAARHGGRVVRTASAPDRAIRAAGAAGTVLAADGHGGFTFPENSPYTDGFGALARLTGLLARRARPLSELVQEVPRTFVRRRELTTPWEAKGAVMRQVAEAAAGLEVDTTEGIRVIEPDGRWALVLPDASRAVTRVWAEAPSADAADALLARWADAVSRSTA
ncbi:sugar phosphate nucleotidyltransferase [Streptomyces sp. NRRL S-118]|uniref:sugar phosphate nucleotidyltransferase n=1 Tax=Streptomyces sp. NRRL S-118 TaxID=1463881 RepID=UPI0004CAB6AB|nr:sugar phosphate nucleotidyltransferase [Streptomyces sp. NRRL S-118]